MFICFCTSFYLLNDTLCSAIFAVYLQVVSVFTMVVVCVGTSVDLQCGDTRDEGLWRADGTVVSGAHEWALVKQPIGEQPDWRETQDERGRVEGGAGPWCSSVHHNQLAVHHPDCWFGVKTKKKQCSEPNVLFWKDQCPSGCTTGKQEVQTRRSLTVN